MVDIDDVVVAAAAKYLRGICHDALDQQTGVGYEVCAKLFLKFDAASRHANSRTTNVIPSFHVRVVDFD